MLEGPHNAEHNKAISILKLTQEAASFFKQLESVQEKRAILLELFESMTANADGVSVHYTPFVAAVANKTKLTKEILCSQNAVIEQ